MKPVVLKEVAIGFEVEKFGTTLKSVSVKVILAGVPVLTSPSVNFVDTLIFTVSTE